MTPEQDTAKDDKSPDAQAGSATADTPGAKEAPMAAPKLPVSGGKKNEDSEPSERPAITPVNINLPVVPPKKSNLKMVVIVILSLVVMAVVGFGIYTMLSMNQGATDNKTTATGDTTNNSAQLKAAVTIMDGKASYSKDGKDWTDLSTSVVLGQGDFVQTQSESRVMLTVDDGSIIRMNAATTIELAQLTPNNIIITNLAGDVYTRVAKSDNRTFSVTVDAIEYTALGTAYKTTNTPDEKGVQVYESSVRAGKDGTKVEEGKQFFEKHKDGDKEKKVTTVPVDELTSDAFLLWNLDQDKKDNEHKDRLGYLKKVEEMRRANKEEGEKPRPADNGGDSNTDATGGVSLSGSEYSKGAYLTWTTSGVSGNDGFKVVRSKDDSTPTYGQNEAQFVGADAREHKWHDTTGKSFYYRVCVYKAGKCSNYSNTVQVKSPYVPPVDVVSGAVTLSNNGSTISWSYSGTAPYGFKLLASTSVNEPTYPGQAVAFLDKNVTSLNLASKLGDGTHYVRICKYKGSHVGGCMNYSNVIQVTLP